VVTKLKLATGNITRTDSGHFKLQILNTRQATFRRFNVKVLSE